MEKPPRRWLAIHHSQLITALASFVAGVFVGTGLWIALSPHTCDTYVEIAAYFTFRVFPVAVTWPAATIAVKRR